MHWPHCPQAPHRWVIHICAFLMNSSSVPSRPRSVSSPLLILFTSLSSPIIISSSFLSFLPFFFSVSHHLAPGWCWAHSSHCNLLSSWDYQVHHHARICKGSFHLRWRKEGKARDQPGSCTCPGTSWRAQTKVNVRIMWMEMKRQLGRAQSSQSEKASSILVSFLDPFSLGIQTCGFY